MKTTFLALAACLSSGATWAQGCPSPNPNLNAPPFVSNCPLPAAALNRLAPQAALNRLAPLVSPAFTGQLSVGGALTSYSALSVQGVLSGSLATAPMDGSTSPLAIIAVTGDTATPTQATSALTVDHFFGGSPATGTHVGIWSNLVKAAPTTGTDYITGVFSNVTAQAAGIGDPGYTQQLYGYAAQVADDGGHHVGAVGGEIDVSLHVANDHIKEGWGVYSAPLTTGNDLYQGTQYSAGYGLSAAGTCGAGALAGGSACAGFVYGFALGRTDSYFPLTATGTVMGVPTSNGSPTAAHGIDFSKITFSADSFKATGFVVSGTGAIQNTGMPTLCSGQPAGTLWNDGGTVKVC